MSTKHINQIGDYNILIQGKAKWAKVNPDQLHWGYENQHKEWSIDVYPDEHTIQRLKTEGLGKNLKDKGNGEFISFKRKEFKSQVDDNGNKVKNDPIRIVDHKGQPWDGRKIGNGSVVNVNFAINEYGKGKKAANILSLQVWEHVPFSGGEFPVKEDNNQEDDWSEEAA